MTNKNESGHANNVENFEYMIGICTGYGAPYDPSPARLQLPGLQALHASATGSLQGVVNARNIYRQAGNFRREAFEDLGSRSGRIIAALEISGTNPGLIANARTIYRKIQGNRATPKPTDGDEESAKTISVSQQSFDSRINNFIALADLLTLEPAYQPNEPELQLAGIQAYIQDLQNLNAAVGDAYVAYTNALIHRDNLLYAEGTGLVDTAQDVKKYVRSVFGSSSDQYKQIEKIYFRRK